MALILDTGPLYAALDRGDRDHARCRRLIEEAGEALVVPSPVIPELEYLVSQRMGPAPMHAFLRDVDTAAYRVADLERMDYVRIVDVMDRFADHDVGFVDAAVLAVVERLNEPKLATLDRRHFAVLRPRHVDALELLPV